MAYIPLRHPLLAHQLDAILSIGWYRMQQHIFTTNQLVGIGEEAFAVYWLRIALANYQPTSRFKKLEKASAAFEIQLQDADINPEIELLYASYLESISFDAAISVAACLLEDHGHNFFPGKMWTIRDNGLLIAVGYFDEGSETCAGILNFYHPDYKKYSLGLLLYLKSVHQAASTGKKWFYPGYIAAGYAKFDYKLLAGGQIEYWDHSTEKWREWTGMPETNIADLIH